MTLPNLQNDAGWLRDEWGIVFDAQAYLDKSWKRSLAMAMDAQPALVTAPSGGIPWFLNAFIDPEVIRVAQSPLPMAKAFGEEKKGDWTTQTAMFTVLEQSGEVAAYGDYSNDGRSDVNANFPQRQSAVFQTIIEYGDREVDQAGEAKLNLIAERQMSAANTLNRYMDYTYTFGWSGLQCYGLSNDPSLPAALTPITKTAGGARWVTVGGTANADALEVYKDFLALFQQLVTQTHGRVDSSTPMVMLYPATVASALGFINQYNVKVREAILAEFPNVEFVIVPRYATVSGNLVQLWAKELEGQKTVVLGFNERLRQHPIVRAVSSAMQKYTGGSWGAIIRQPLGCAQMLGV